MRLERVLGVSSWREFQELGLKLRYPGSSVRVVQFFLRTFLGKRRLDSERKDIVEQIAGLLRLWSVVGQVAVELGDLGGSLCDLVVGLVVGVLCRGN